MEATMTQETKECPYVKLGRLAQDHLRRVDTIATLTKEVSGLNEQLRKKSLELQENINAKVGVEAKMKAAVQELA
jgi:phosphoglycerate-specific signal transduction histidine kinase